jgi:hypothetical protein
VSRINLIQSNYKSTQNKRATPINPVGTLFMVNVLAFVDCATAGPDVREGIVTFEEVCKGWPVFPALAPLTNLAALAAYAFKFCGPDCGLQGVNRRNISAPGQTHGLMTPTIPFWQLFPCELKIHMGSVVRTGTV